MKKAFKVLFIGIICLLLLAGLTSIFISYFYSDTLQQELVSEFETQTDHQYSISISDIDLGFLTRTVTIDSMRVEPNVNSKLRSISAASVSINGIRWLSWWSQPVPDFSQIEVISPQVEIVVPQDYSFQANQLSNNSSQTAALDSLDNFNFTLKNGRGILIEEGSERELLSIDDISLEATEVNLQQLLSQSKILFLDGLSVKGSGIKWPLYDTFYEMNIGDFSFDKAAQSAQISNLNFTPTLPKYKFSQEHGHQLDRIQLEIPEIELLGFDLDSLINNRFDVDTLQLKNAWMEVFRNKQIPRPEEESVKPLFYELASATDFSLGIETILVSNSDIIYEEHKPPSDSTGSISFNELSATLTDFKTMQHPKFNEAVFRWDVETLFMNSSPLSVQVEYPLYDMTNTHTVKAQLESIDPKEVSGMLRNVGFIELKDGFVEGMETEMTLNSDSATGEVLIEYRDLKVKFLNDENPEKNGLKQRVKTFVANTFAIKSNNTGEDAETGQIDFEREKNKSIFAYWWKSLLSGMKDVIR
ncbi:hypothetical protein [Gracilimonas tropica]|uniref:hypothetical protein n=1 Tax=Gracilimonas tropica TaxID=454600 RepID=UPI000380A9EB|nr:hypothetical protein [Gracilimonas tropica]